MNTTLTHILAFGSLAVILTLIIFLYGPLGNRDFFFIASWITFILLLAALALILFQILKIGEKSNLIILFFVLLIMGFALAFFNWFIGGIVALVSILLLLLSPKIHGTKEIFMVYGGFFLLAILPPLEALFSISPSILDYILISVALGVIVTGLYLAAKRIELPLMLGFIFLSLAFLTVAPLHEALGIHNNGTYGIYDSSIIILASATFFLFLFSLLHYDVRYMKLQEKIGKGYEYIEKGDYKKAEGLFRILYKKSRNREVLNGLSIALMRGGKLDEAEKILKLLVKRYPEETYLLNLGNLYCRKGSYGLAMEIYKKILKKNSKSYNALNNLARCYMELREYEKAKILLERAMKISSKNKVAETNYRLLLKKMRAES